LYAPGTQAGHYEELGFTKLRLGLRKTCQLISKQALENIDPSPAHPTKTDGSHKRAIGI
jgi:hypothetical protein